MLTSVLIFGGEKINYRNRRRKTKKNEKDNFGNILVT
jgi:hypothetical protein